MDTNTTGTGMKEAVRSDTWTLPPVPTSPACPNCGYCSHCGRRSYYPHPYYPRPQWPYYPVIL